MLNWYFFPDDIQEHIMTFTKLGAKTPLEHSKRSLRCKRNRKLAIERRNKLRNMRLFDELVTEDQERIASCRN